MKRTAKIKSKYLEYLSLYLDDIEQILELLKDNCESITASCEGYELEHPTEINEYKELSKEQFKTLQIKGDTPSVTVSMYQHTMSSGVSVFIFGDDLKSLGLYTAIVDILKKRQNRFIYFYKSISAFLLITALLAFILIYLVIKYNLDPNVISVVCIVWFTIHFITTTDMPWSRFTVKLNKEYSHQRTNFIIRNRDQIILLLIGALIGFGFSLLLKLSNTVK